jgi:branched-chain amino acid aminotransferase
VLAHVDGDLVPESDGAVPLRDPGVAEGAGAVVTARAFGGTVLAWAGYASRLREAAGAVGIDPSGIPGAADLRERVTATLAANDIADARVRLSVTAGVRSPTVTVVLDPLPRGGLADRTAHPGPAALHTADVRAIPPASVPMARWTHNRLDRRLAARAARRADADEALLCDVDGDVVGGAESDLFVMGPEALTTPRVEVPPDPLREVVIDLATDEGLPVRRAPLTPEEVRRADEAFLVNPTWGVRPVASVDDQAVGAGPVATLLARLFDERVERTCYEGVRLDEHDSTAGDDHAADGE